MSLPVQQQQTFHWKETFFGANTEINSFLNLPPVRIHTEYKDNQIQRPMGQCSKSKIIHSEKKNFIFFWLLFESTLLG